MMHLVDTVLHIPAELRYRLGARSFRGRYINIKLNQVTSRRKSRHPARRVFFIRSFIIRKCQGSENSWEQKRGIAKNR